MFTRAHSLGMVLLGAVLCGAVGAAEPPSEDAPAPAWAPRAVTLTAPAPKNLRVQGRVLAVSHRAVYVLNPYADDSPDYYQTPSGPALRLRRLAWDFPFEALDEHALYRDAPWVFAQRRQVDRLYTPQRVLRVLLDQLERPVLEVSGVELPQEGLLKDMSSARLMWELSQRDISRPRLALLRAYPALLAPAWAYLSSARDQLRRIQKITPTAIGGEAIMRIDEVEKAIGRLMNPVTPIGTDRAQLEALLVFISSYAGSPGSLTTP